MNSTLRSLVFWMVLVIVGVLVWSFSSQLNTKAKSMTFTEFVGLVDTKQIGAVTLTGQEITGTSRSNEAFRVIVPLGGQYEGLVNRLIGNDVVVTVKQEATSPWGALLGTWAPILLKIGF